VRLPTVRVGQTSHSAKQATNIKITNLHPHQTRNNSPTMAPIDDVLAALESRKEDASFLHRQLAKRIWLFKNYSGA
jgi:hypothetical protein